MDKIIKMFKVPEGKKITLKDYDAQFTNGYTKEDCADLLIEYRAEMNMLQGQLYALHKHSLLIIFQAMDAAGKDSAIEHAMSGLNPQGCQVYSFKEPGAEELDHDFLWRHHKSLPERGKIGIHNRSHYENVLACKVHPEYVLNERIAAVSSVKDMDKDFWKSRYKSIRDFEEHISRNGTVIIKFFLNVSKDEQKERFLERINEPLKNWKFSASDINERERWDEYMTAYEEAISETSEEYAPWYIIPADKKWFTRIAISKIVVHTLKSLKLKLPELSDEKKEQLEDCKRRLLAEK